MNASTPSSPRPTRAMSIGASATEGSPKITRFWNVSTAGTPRTACSDVGRLENPRSGVTDRRSNVANQRQVAHLDSAQDQSQRPQVKPLTHGVFILLS